jgi:iron complex outermembrane receptor protein
MYMSYEARRAAALPLLLGLLASTPVLVAHAQPHEAVDEVIVTGLPRDRAAGELAQSVTIVRGEELDRTRAASLGETLASQLGVSSSQFGAGASRPIIRGLAGARVQMLEDGIDTMDAATVSDDHAVVVDPLVADQVEIFRGPTTLLYGSGAVGGVVNTVTTRIPTRAAEGLDGSFELRGDSVADSRSVGVRLDGGRKGFGWHFDGVHRDSSDYEIPGFARVEPDPSDVFGVVTNSAAEADAAAFGASWLGEAGFVGAGVSMFDTLYGIPSHVHEGGAEQEPAVRIDLDQRRLDLRGGWMGLEGAIEGVSFGVGAIDYHHVELEGDEVGTEFTNDAAELRLELLHTPIGRWTGAFGAQYGARRFAAIGEEAFVPPVDSETLGLFLVEQRDFREWELSLGGRLETTEHLPSNDSPDYDETATSVSLGGVRELGDGYSFAVNVAFSERIPVAEELYSDGPHLATGVIQIGDAGLSTEAARHVDIGLRSQRERFSFGITAFRTRYDDFIYLADTGVVDPAEDLPIFVYTQADAEFSGLEAELFVPLLTRGEGGLDLRLFADYVRGELASGESLPRLPPPRYGTRLEYHGARFLAGIEATRYAEQDDAAAYEDPTAGYVLTNADFRWRFAAGTAAEVELFVTATNLGDEEARKHTSFVKDIAPLPGRNYAVGVRSRF